SRNRSARAGFRPYIRATCNPVPESDKVGGWLAKLIAWWIDQKTGYAIPERAGVERWFARVNEELVFADSREELVALHPKSLPKSLTFIPSKLSDNVILMQNDPAYLGALMALQHRHKTGEGQVVDSAIYEAVLANMESTVAEYTVAGHIRERTGSSWSA
ncbi:hypothetical protein LCGC14_3086020, partial [marine sediment metagenome]